MEHLTTGLAGPAARPVPFHVGILGSGDCGRSDYCTGALHKTHSDTPVHPAPRCGSAQSPAWPGGERAATGWHTSGDRQDHTGERYPPVLSPQAGHHILNRLVSLRFCDGSQVSVDGSGGRRSVSQITLDNA